VHFANQPFIPVSGLYAGQRCGGVGVRVTDPAPVRSMRVGLEIASLMQKIYPKNFDATKTLLLLGNEATVQALGAGTRPEEIIASWGPDLAAFDQTRRKYFLYN